ncbi:MAG: MBL fold metallo-hydrolase [Gemmatimonadales bacterium]
MRLTLLGTGTSFGVPQIGCTCRVCTSTDPKDKRTRTAALVESGGSRILIDTPPELRLQLLAARVGAVDAVLYTHDHADHTHGIDDLRALSGGSRGTLPLFGPEESLARMRHKFDYVFDPEVRPLPGSARPRVTATVLEPGRPALIAGTEVFPIAFEHGPTRVFGYRFGKLAYVTDVHQVTAAAVAALAGVEVLVLNALFYRSHPTHLSVPEAVAAARAIGATRTFLTHLTHETAHADLERDLPPEVRPAYDGLVVEV